MLASLAEHREGGPARGLDERPLLKPPVPFCRPRPPLIWGTEGLQLGSAPPATLFGATAPAWPSRLTPKVA
eukprot:4422209-Alexandrium_andersonii.AAC.1